MYYIDDILVFAEFVIIIIYQELALDSYLAL